MAMRDGIERETDRLDAAPYAHLGPDGVARPTELATAFARTALGAGAFPADPLGRRWSRVTGLTSCVADLGPRTGMPRR
ncbi:hypothetical protein FM21_16725 [Streptomyces mutabilis]|uniref:Uncharacterized protein n=1 Tax=Streptomyces mutabilis TaxID=67332 RepID=A0A086MUI3_9ACTN|nr:hypothetical protein FM21_16725 [Streptomyces mutabilis]